MILLSEVWEDLALLFKDEGGTNTALGVWTQVYSLARRHFNNAKVVADLGCGKHLWTYPGAKMIRYDYTPDPCLNVQPADLNNGIPLADKSVDCAVAVEVIEHLENPRFFLREIKRVIKQAAIITTPNGIASGWYSKERYTGWGHITIMEDWLLEKHLEVAQLKVLEKCYNNPESKEILVYAISET